jgi:hypothetical protein
MPNHLQSKTMAGLLLLLTISVGLDLTHQLNPQIVELIKFIGASFMAVRTVANLPGNNANK